MTTLPEEAVKAAIAAHNKYYDDLVIYPSEEPTPEGAFHEALKAALPFLPVQGAVKKLEWREDKYPKSYTSGIGPLTYSVFWDDEAEWSDIPEPYDLILGEDDGDTLGSFETADAAKAAAQADFEARILSALEPSAARELALDVEFATIRAMIYCYEGDSAQAFEAQKALAKIEDAIRTLLSPDHADAGKVEGDGWRPIESAPKDGTVIDLWSDEYGRLTDCYWGAPMAYEGGETGWVHAHSNEWAESPDEFVHWRPLPLPPIKGGRNG
ncbi:hypothetical protein [Brucella pseudintermedia]|uniref:hypothetical protein n=1 Tax=Brucella pseudintermedia TaxID=370111 RepID=UPI00124CA8EE|nr:hypothetical protein [Brucella pseudintermedia]KAB2680367.1 hypothetical protein F9K78_16910 [Brucella pseudintermedia]